MLCPLTVAAQGNPDNRTVVGANPWLSDGARALQFKDYAEGIRLTLIGLKGPVSERNRIAAFSNLCAGYVGLGDYLEALYYCDQALELDPDNWHALNNRALAHLGLEEKEKATADVDAGLEVKPGSRKLSAVQQLIRDSRNPRVVIDDRPDFE